ncbi:Myosin IE heavy chain [Diplonema papillatum]|nr:Myosin IE heavy chain [Diplonema papillatum]
MHVSINPYTSDLPGGPLYGIPALEPGAPVEDALGEEHPGQAALAARRRILAGGAGTCFLMTGESGSGKTEATRGILALFSGLAGGGTGEAPDAAVSPVTVVGEKAAAGGALFLAGNLLVEALGCAKTERNDNSSRFGKRVTVRFSRATGAVSGTRHRAFLLEASRVLAHGASERSFHAFYAIFRGPPALKARLLGENARPHDFPCLNPGASNLCRGVDDAEVYRNVAAGLSAFGVPEAEQADRFWAVVACVLHLSKVTFSEAPAKRKGGVVLQTGGGGCSVDDMAPVEAAARALGTAPGVLAALLTTSTATIRAGSPPAARRRSSRAGTRRRRRRPCETAWRWDCTKRCSSGSSRWGTPGRLTKNWYGAFLC